MSGGPKFEYLWADKDRYKKPTQLPAPQYVSLLMDWIEAQINDENLFPVSTGMHYNITIHIKKKKKVHFVLFKTFMF